MSDEDTGLAMLVFTLLAFFIGIYVGDDVLSHAIKTKHPITPTRIEVTINPETMASDTAYIYIAEE